MGPNYSLSHNPSFPAMSLSAQIQDPTVVLWSHLLSVLQPCHSSVFLVFRTLMLVNPSSQAFWKMPLRLPVDTRTAASDVEFSLVFP